MLLGYGVIGCCRVCFVPCCEGVVRKDMAWGTHSISPHIYNVDSNLSFLAPAPPPNVIFVVTWVGYGFYSQSYPIKFIYPNPTLCSPLLPHSLSHRISNLDMVGFSPVSCNKGEMTRMMFIANITRNKTTREQRSGSIFGQKLRNSV